ncbi:Phosphoribosylformylglycinamidine synthase, PurS subunit [Hyphomicrobiales bacterium]|nr:Phosphoribosylformylglycinamidine synthase, PurS subunit [Hyphomicrobiales bacterium]
MPTLEPDAISLYAKSILLYEAVCRFWRVAMKARVIVTLKTGVLDPQGKAIEGALASLGVDGVASVRQGKVFDVELSTADQAKAEAALKQACEKLLANTVIENYRIETGV